MLKQTAQRAAIVVAPVFAGRALDALTSYLHVISGQGAGSGWDHSETDMARGLVSSAAPVVFDVGANNGLWSRSLSAKLPAQASFHLFECAPVVIDGLRENIQHVSNATHVNAAVSDREGTATLRYPAHAGVGGGLGSLYERRDVSVPQIEYASIDVPTIRLDDYSDKAGISAIDLLKIDIEGHELAAMHGAERLFKEHRVKAITFEFGSANVNSRTFFRDYWDLLGDHGFAISRALPGGKLLPVTRYSETLEYFRGATNYAATLR